MLFTSLSNVVFKSLFLKNYPNLPSNQLLRDYTVSELKDILMHFCRYKVWVLNIYSWFLRIKHQNLTSARKLFVSLPRWIPTMWFWFRRPGVGLDISTGEPEAQPGMRTTALSLRTLTSQKPEQNSSLTRPALAWGGRSIHIPLLCVSFWETRLEWCPSYPVRSSSISDKRANRPNPKDPPLFSGKWQNII